MKCIVTGHTSGVGKYLYEHFSKKGYEVKGMSRSNGYDITKDIDKIVNESTGCDLFINNASNGSSQLNILRNLCTKVSRIVTMGSSSTDYLDILNNQYNLDKKELEDSSRLISSSPRSDLSKILLIKLSFAEETYSREKTNRINSDYTISYKEIANVIDFWIDNHNITKVEFIVKLTDYTIDQIKTVTNNSIPIDALCNRINDLILP